MIIRPLVRPGVLSLVVGLTAVMSQRGGAVAPDQSASLILNFTRDYYAMQNVDEANANKAYPLATLLLDFASDKYFVGGY